MTTVIRHADAGDLGVICRLRAQRTAWLTARGSDQWTVAGQGLSTEIFANAVRAAVAAGQTWVAEVGGEPAGTITINDHAGNGLWSSWELSDSLIVHFMIVDLRFAGLRIGHRLLAHAGLLARQRGRQWVRLDAWTTNTDLHNYYRRAGFRLTRIADQATTSPSCALFERRTDSWRHDHLSPIDELRPDALHGADALHGSGSG